MRPWASGASTTLLVPLSAVSHFFLQTDLPSLTQSAVLVPFFMQDVQAAPPWEGPGVSLLAQQVVQRVR
eukprot:11678744-Heterocapsa_arctica.AAC.1